MHEIVYLKHFILLLVTFPNYKVVINYSNRTHTIIERTLIVKMFNRTVSRTVRIIKGSDNDYQYVTGSAKRGLIAFPIVCI